MNSIYEATKANDGHRTILDERTLTRDVSHFEHVGSTIALNKRLAGLKRAFPIVPLDSCAREQIIHLVDCVFLFPNSVRSKIVAFSNIDAGTGSSEVCLNAGYFLAKRIPGNVCVIDANGKRSLLCRLFAADDLPGLSDAIDVADGFKDLLVQLSDSNLWLLPTGSEELDSCRFSPDRLHARIMELGKHFDYILIDAPAATAARTILLGQMADGVIIVIEAHRTRREAARMAKETLEAAHIPVLGAVLNNRTFPIPEALYRKL